jgi:DNA repair protein RadC
MTEHLIHLPNEQILTLLARPKAAKSVVTAFPTLTELAQASYDKILQLESVGPVRADAIAAGLELGRRVSKEVLGPNPIMDCPEKISQFLREDVRPYRTEAFKVILLNTRRALIRVVDLASGTLATLLVHPREVFRAAIESNAASIVLVHNHPSGDPTPSEADIKVTRDLIRAGHLLKIEVVDHVILGTATTERPKDYSSLRELGYFCA